MKIVRIAPFVIAVAAVAGSASAPAVGQSFGVRIGADDGRTAFGLSFGHRDHDRRDHGRRHEHGRGDHDRYDRGRGHGHGHGRGHARREWVPGRFETVVRQVWVEGCERRVWREAVYETVYDWLGRPVRRCVSEGRWEIVREPGRYETRYEQVWREGYWRDC